MLAELGAGEFEHTNGSLVDHLKGTEHLLKTWSAPKALRDAGLYHAAYGTAGFKENFASLTQRKAIADIIGSSSEEIVYQYCACDRDDFFSRFGKEANPLFRNRYTAESYYLGDDLLKNFCELTAANEIDIAMNNNTFVAKHGQDLAELFSRMAIYLSTPAKKTIKSVLGSNV